MSNKFRDGIHSGRDDWRNRISVLSATASVADADRTAPVTLHWTRHPDAVGYHILRVDVGVQAARPRRINGRRPVAAATTCAQFCTFVPKGSDLWGQLCDGLNALDAGQKARIEADKRGLARFSDEFVAARLTSRALDPFTGGRLFDPLPNAIDPCAALERGLSEAEAALFDAVAQVNLRLRMARGLAFIDRTARYGTRYAYSLLGVDREGQILVLAENVIIEAGILLRPAPPSGIEVSAKDHKVLLLWNRHPRAHDYVVERSEYPGGPFQRIHDSPILFDINEDLDGADLTPPENPPRPGFVDYRHWNEDGIDEGHAVDGTVIFGPANGTTYYYRVASCDINGQRGAWSATFAVVPVRTLPPQAPRQLTVTATTEPKGLKLEWRKVTRDVEGRQIPDATQTYEIHRARTQAELSDLATLSGCLLSTESANPIDEKTPVLDWTDTDPVLEPPYGEQDYYYRLICVDTDNNRSAPSAAVSGRIPDTTPPGPTQVVRSEGDETWIRVYWDLNSEEDVTGYLIFRGACNHGTLELGEIEEVFRRKVCDLLLVGQLSAKEAEQRKIQDGHAWFEDTTVPEGSPICFGYWVRAYDAAQNLYPGLNGCPRSKDEFACARLIEKTPPPVPVITGLAARDRAVEIDWIASPVQDQRAFHIYRSEKESGPLVFVGCVLLDGSEHSGPWTGVVPKCGEIPAAAPTTLVRGRFTDHGLEPQQIYWYRVSALDWLGNESEGTDLTVIPAISTFAYTQELPVTPFIQPTPAQAVSGCGLRLNWQAPVSADVVGFVVFRRAGTSAWRQVSGILKDSVFEDATALRGVSYGYRVQSINARGRLSQPSPAVTRSY